MATSTITSKGQTTVPKEVREALDLEAGDKLTWEVRGGRVAITTERPALYELEGFIKHIEFHLRAALIRNQHGPLRLALLVLTCELKDGRAGQFPHVQESLAGQGLH